MLWVMVCSPTFCSSQLRSAVLPLFEHATLVLSYFPSAVVLVHRHDCSPLSSKAFDRHSEKTIAPYVAHAGRGAREPVSSIPVTASPAKRRPNSSEMFSLACSSC